MADSTWTIFRIEANGTQGYGKLSPVLGAGGLTESTPNRPTFTVGTTPRTVTITGMVATYPKNTGPPFYTYVLFNLSETIYSGESVEIAAPALTGWIHDVDNGSVAITTGTAVENISTATDTTAPTPDPATWATPPAADSTTAISMTATTATDPSDVEYYFACTAGGGNDSGWQDSAEYTDTGLTPGTEYTYTVQYRDKSAGQNTGTASAPASATTTAAAWTTPLGRRLRGIGVIGLLVKR